MRAFMTFAASVMALTGPSYAATEFLTVSGKANPYLAGQTGNMTYAYGDTLAVDAPTLSSLSLYAGEMLTFSVTGATSNVSGGASGNPDGSGGLSMTYDYGTGIAGAQNISMNALVGVFLGNSSPSTMPASLDFSGGLNFTSLTPGIGQIFFIGDGLTGTGSGASQNFIVPEGATRLYLGSSDGYEWNNNSGKFKVGITPVTAVPETSSWAMMIAGLGMVGVMVRRGRRQQQKAARVTA